MKIRSAVIYLITFATLSSLHLAMAETASPERSESVENESVESESIASFNCTFSKGWFSYQRSIQVDIYLDRKIDPDHSGDYIQVPTNTCSSDSERIRFLPTNEKIAEEIIKDMNEGPKAFHSYYARYYPKLNQVSIRYVDSRNLVGRSKQIDLKTPNGGTTQTEIGIGGRSFSGGRTDFYLASCARSKELLCGNFPTD